MSGIELARAARNMRADMRVLLTSGYVGAKASLAESEFPLIDKPYERTVLAARLRELLGARRRKGQKDAPADSAPIAQARVG